MSTTSDILIHHEAGVCTLTFHRVDKKNAFTQAMYSQLEGLGMTQQQASGWIAQQITNQGLIISANEIFWMSAGIFLVLLGLVWFAKPPFGAGGGGGGAH